MRLPLITALLSLGLTAAAWSAPQEPATWDSFLSHPPANVAEADAMSLQLNQLYREAAHRGSSQGIEWWVAEVDHQTDENIRHARAALKTAPALDARWKREATRFVEQYAGEQRRLASLYRRTPSEIGLRPGETAGWNLPDRTLVLTFDDGPNPTLTGRILNSLRASKYPAMFFVLGKSLQQARQAGAVPDYSGFPVGSHTFSHAFLPELSATAVRSELESNNAEIARAKLPRPDLFRAPYGARGPRELGLVDKLGMHSVLWNIDSQDWQASMQRQTGRIAGRTVALALLRRHGIILMHDTQPKTPDELKLVLPVLEKAGYHFTTDLH